MRRALLRAVVARFGEGCRRRFALPLLAALALLAGCSLYAPSITDCSLRCDDSGGCPTGSACSKGFCRPPGATGACECHPGDARACGGDAGLCLPGVQQCGTDGTWSSTCLGEGRPSEEICDGQDNDCNGRVDDAVKDAKPCPLALGVCAGHGQGCDAGVRVACDDSSYGPTFERLETACDGLDNDCDGELDSSRAAVLATDAVGPWSWLGSDAGFALIYGRPAVDGGLELAVRRFDGRFAPRGADAVVDVGPAIDSWASALGDDVYVAWQTGGALFAARVAGSGAVTRFADAGVAIGPGPVRSGVGERFFAAGYSASFMGLEAVQWELDGGVAQRFSVDPLDAGLSTQGILGFAVSDRGHSFVYTYLALDGGVGVRPLVRTDDGGVVTLIDYYGGTSAYLVETSTALTATYAYSAPSGLSGCYFLPDVVNHVPELTVKETTTSATAYGACTAAADATGKPMLAVEDAVRSATVLERAAGGATAFQERVLPPGSGTGEPHLAAIEAGATVGLAWRTGTTISARRVCW